MRGEIKQQIDPAFGVTKTDVQFHVREEAMSKTATSNPRALVSRPNVCVIPSVGEAGWGLLPCTVSCSQGLQELLCCLGSGSIALHGRKAKLHPKIKRVVKGALLNHICVHGPYFS